VAVVKVKPRNLKRGDELKSGLIVTEVWDDPEGTWIATSDGEAGYVQSEERPFLVVSYG
jgi:hypothetical protein